MSTNKQMCRRVPLPTELRSFPSRQESVNSHLWYSEESRLRAVLEGKSEPTIPLAFLRDKRVSKNRKVVDDLRSKPMLDVLHQAYKRLRPPPTSIVGREIKTLKTLAKLVGMSDPLIGTPLALNGSWMMAFLRWQHKAFISDNVEWLSAPSSIAAAETQKGNLFITIEEDVPPLPEKYTAASKKDYDDFMRYMEHRADHIGDLHDESQWRLRMQQVRSTNISLDLAFPRADNRVHFEDLPIQKITQSKSEIANVCKNLLSALVSSHDEAARDHALGFIKKNPEFWGFKATDRPATTATQHGKRAAQCTPLSAHFTAVPALYAGRTFTPVQYLTLIYLHSGDMSEAGHAASLIWGSPTAMSERIAGLQLAQTLWRRNRTIEEVNLTRGRKGTVTLAPVQNPMLEEGKSEEEISRAMSDEGLMAKMEIIFLSKGKEIPKAEAVAVATEQKPPMIPK